VADHNIHEPRIDAATGFRVIQLPSAGPPKAKKKPVPRHLLSEYKGRALRLWREGEDLEHIARLFGVEARIVDKWIEEEAEVNLASAYERHRREREHLADAERYARRQMRPRFRRRSAPTGLDKWQVAEWLATAAELSSEAKRAAAVDHGDQEALDASRLKLLRHLNDLDNLLGSDFES
jgi:hypothetical protein